MYVYIVECKDGSLYTGCSNNPERRLIEHNTSKRGAKSIRGKLPVKLVYTEKCLSIREALKREKEIKRWSRTKKLVLVKSENALTLMSAATKRG